MCTVDLLYYIFSSLIVISALFILVTDHILYAALMLMLTLLGIAAIYILVNAEFIAVTQLMVYVGGILLLILFGIMLTSQEAKNTLRLFSYQQFFRILWVCVLFTLLLLSIFRIDFKALGWIKNSLEGATTSPTENPIEKVGLQLLSKYALIFELVALLLLIALVGAVYIARRNHQNKS
ncbi:MAG: NADH-quinone oxidoreductase subunit J [Cytophagales bacterium]|nr:NADH-quinone oxidoreductase subunit J [Cytophagales bacterium]